MKRLTMSLDEDLADAFEAMGPGSRLRESIGGVPQVRRVITPRFAVTLDVLNLFDRKFYDIAYEQDCRLTPTGPVVPNGVTVHPGEPRALRLTLNVTL
jgi:hypothetical protein